MKTSMTMFAATLLASMHARADEQGKAPPPVSVEEILSADVSSAGQAIVFPKRNGHVTVSVFTIQPGATLPATNGDGPVVLLVIDQVEAGDAGNTTLQDAR